jgi:hypothetical protein
MFNRVNKCASEYLCNLLLHVQTMKSIPNLFENGNVVVQRPNKSFMKKNPSLSTIFQLNRGGQFYFWRTTNNRGNIFKNI